MASTSASRRTASTPAEQAIFLFPDDIWEEILLRLDAAADLARASAACSSFRRIVSARRFLRRFRCLHPPPVLGFINTNRRRPRFVPVRPPNPAREARALDRGSDFTFSFLPDPSAWRVRHARDGRVLLGQRISTRTQFEDFLVCDPLHRRCVKIPRIPDDLMAACARFTRPALPVLAPAGNDDDDEEESFRVVCSVHSKSKGKVAAFIFSSRNQTWRAVISTISLPNGFIEGRSYFAHGCLYWVFSGIPGQCYYLLMLDTSEMRFSLIDLTPHNHDPMFAIVEATNGRLGLLTLGFSTLGDDSIHLYCKNLQSNDVGTQGWLHNKHIPLPKVSGINYNWQIGDIAGRYLALIAYHGDESDPLIFEHFVLDIKTLLFEKLYTNDDAFNGGLPYATLPQPLALPSI